MGDSEPKAYEPDQSLQKMIGGSDVLRQVFSKEKIAASQKVLDKAKASFFDVSKPEMDAIDALIKDNRYADNYQELCRKLFQPVSNIRGQARIFGFPLIDSICKYLIEYCEVTAKTKKMQPRDIFIISKLTEALQKTFHERIMDEGGEIERGLKEVIDLVRK